MCIMMSNLKDDCWNSFSSIIIFQFSMLKTLTDSMCMTANQQRDLQITSVTTTSSESYSSTTWIRQLRDVN